MARLARLSLTDQEVEQFKGEISSILEYVEQLHATETSSFEPTSQVTGLVNVMRQDVVKDYGATPDELLKNVPSREGRHIKVKRILE